jgi:glycosyltransferase involved in cell wall biosynthesis
MPPPPTPSLVAEQVRTGTADRPLHILDITKFYSAASGGVRTYLDEKIRVLVGQPVSHALVIPGEADGLTVRHATRVYTVAGPRIPLAPGYRLLVARRRLDSIMERERPDIVEVGSPFLVPLLVRWARRRRPFRTVGFYHSDLIRTYAEPYVTNGCAAPARVVTRVLARSYISRVYRRFDATVAASPVVARELRHLGVRNVHCIPLGVDLELFQPGGEVSDVRARFGIPADVPVLLYAGRFCPEKRLDVVLRAHALLGQAAPHLVLVGDGVLRPALEAEAARRARLSILCHEPDRRRLAAIYRSADVCIAPGPGETFGLALAEAMACGLPAVVVNSGAAPDRVAGCSAAAPFRHGDARSCAAAIRSLLQRLSPELRRDVRQHALRRFSWTATFDALLLLYHDLARQQAVTAR